MSVSPITNSLASYVKRVTSGGTPQTGGTSQNTASSALQEAQETPEVTAKEAANGDRQAIAKLALEKQRQQEQAQETAQAKEPGKGEIIDKNA
jgi:hypothetical protein